MNSYLLTTADGEIEIFQGEVDRQTSLVLSGPLVGEWGEHYAQNFLNLLSNFASPSLDRPTAPTSGQLWYDMDEKALKVYDKASNTWARTSFINGGINVSLTGAISGSGTFDGQSDINIATSLEEVNQNPGPYQSANIVVDRYGRVVSASTGSVGESNATEVNSVTVRSPSNVDRPAQIGAVVLTAADVTHALGYTPYNSTNPSGFAPAPNLNPYLLLDGTRPMQGNLNMNAKEITNLAQPTSQNSAVRKADLEAVANSKTLRTFQGQPSLTYRVTVSPNAPSGGNNGDVWYRY